MKKRKFLLAAVALLLIFGIGSTIAYLTDTDTATNTFTIGGVDITLTEPNWVATSGENIVPGQTITKDPTITNVSTTNDAYVFMKVEVPCTTTSTPAPREIFTYTVNSSWTEIPSAATTCTNGKATHVYYYGSGSLSALAKNNTATPALFAQVKLVQDLTNDELTNLGHTAKDMVITGYGIQNDGLESTVPATVWGYFS